MASPSRVNFADFLFFISFQRKFLEGLYYHCLTNFSATLLGDAAHLMTPFAGVGVNVAMEDAMELARAVIALKPTWKGKDKFEGALGLSEAVRKYELAMFDRAEGYAKETWMYLNLFFNERGGHAMVESFAEQKKQKKKQVEAKALENKETVVNLEEVIGA